MGIEQKDVQIRDMDLSVWMRAKAAAALSGQTLSQWIKAAILEKLSRGTKG